MFWFKSWIVYPYVDRFLDYSCLPLVVPAYNIETVVSYVGVLFVGCVHGWERAA